MKLERRENAITEFSAMGFILALLPVLCLAARHNSAAAPTSAPAMRPSPVAQVAPHVVVAREPATEKRQPAAAPQSIGEIKKGIQHQKLSSAVEAILEERGMNAKKFIKPRIRGLDVALPGNDKVLAEQIIAAVKSGDVPATVEVSIDDVGKIQLKIREEPQ